MESFALEKLAVKLNGTPLGAKDSLFTNLQDSRTCDENSLCFVRDSKFLATLSPNAGAVITTEALAKKLQLHKILLLLIIRTLLMQRPHNYSLRNITRTMQRLSQKLAQMSLLEKTL